jgi:hypothetical protein
MASLFIATTAQQHLLSDSGDMHAIGCEHVTDRQASAADEGVAGEIVEMPAVGAHRAMKPHRVIQAGRISTVGI